MLRLILFSFIFLLFNSCNHTESMDPTISGLSVSLGQVGRTISIYGQRFSSDTSKDIVTFNGTLAQVTSASPQELQVVVPAGATTGSVIVTVNGRSVTGPIFTVYVPGVLTSRFPICGPAGTEIIIEGSGFETMIANMSVAFSYSTGEIPLTITSLSTTQIKVLVPTGIPNESLGHLVVKAFGTEQLFIDGTSSGNLSFAYMPFTIISSAPDSGARGTEVVINGAGFGNDPLKFQVLFFDTPNHAYGGTITNITETQITVTVPNGAVLGENPFYLGVSGSNVYIHAGTFTVTN